MALPRILPSASISHHNGTSDFFGLVLVWFAATANHSSSCTQQVRPVRVAETIGDVWNSEFFASAPCSSKQKLFVPSYEGEFRVGFFAPAPCSFKQKLFVPSYEGKFRVGFSTSAPSSFKEKQFVVLSGEGFWRSEFFPSASSSYKEEVVRIVGASTSSYHDNIGESEFFQSASSSRKEELLLNVGASTAWYRELIHLSMFIELPFFCWILGKCILGFLYTNLHKDRHKRRYRCKADWNSSSLMLESPNKAGTVSEFNTRKSSSKNNKFTENESHLSVHLPSIFFYPFVKTWSMASDADLSRVEHGINETKAKTVADWIAATGAPHHATGNRDLLSAFVIEHDDQFVHAVDGVPRKVLARGAVITEAVILPDVWYVPGLPQNLVSVSQLAELDHSIGFVSGDCCIRSGPDAKIVGKGRLQKDGQYVLDYLKVPLAI